MIDDRIEEGFSEDEAVAAVGNVDEVVAQIIATTPLIKIAKERAKPKKKLTALEIVLLVLGSPVWLSLLVAIIAVIFSCYVSVWSVIVSLWSVFVALAICPIGGVLGCIMDIASGYVLSGIAMLAMGIVCAGLAIFMFYGCRETTKGILIFTKKIALWIKNCFIKKEVE